MRCRFLTASQDELYLDVEDPALFAGVPHMGSTPVPGIGDKASWEHNEFGSWLHILKDGNFVSMGLPRTIKTMTPAIERAGKLIASRM